MHGNWCNYRYSTNGSRGCSLWGEVGGDSIVEETAEEGYKLARDWNVYKIIAKGVSNTVQRAACISIIVISRSLLV